MWVKPCKIILADCAAGAPGAEPLTSSTVRRCGAVPPAWPALFLLIARRNLRWLLPAIILAVPIVRMATYFAEPRVREQLHLMFHTGMDTILVGAFVAMHRDALSARLRPLLTHGWMFSFIVVVLLLLLPMVQLELGGLWTATYGATFEAATMSNVKGLDARPTNGGAN